MRAKKLMGLLTATVTAAAILAGCGSGAAAPAQTTAGGENAQTSETTAAQAAAPSGEFNPDNEAGVSIEEIREANGAVPVTAGTKAGIVAKAFENEYWRTLKEGYEEGAKKISAMGYDVTVDVRAPQGETDEQGQLAIVDNMINQGFNMLLLSPISDANLTPAVEVANEEGIPVLNVNDGLIAKAPYFVGPKAYQNGELAAEWISEKLGGQGQVAIVIGMPKAFAARQRTAGFEDWMAANASGIEVVAKQNADWDRQASKELAETWMQQYPDLKAIFCNNDTMALGVVEAVEEQGKDILVVGVDGIGEAYDSIRSGKLDATIDSFPFYKAQIALECGLRALAGQEIPRVVWTPQALIDSTNVDTEAAEIIHWTDAEYTAAQ